MSHKLTKSELRWIREDKGLTQAEAARAIGVSRVHYNRLETGQRELPGFKRQAVLTALRSSDEHLQGYVEVCKADELKLAKLKLDLAQAREFATKLEGQLGSSDDTVIEAEIVADNIEARIYELKYGADGLVRMVKDRTATAKWLLSFYDGPVGTAAYRKLQRLAVTDAARSAKWRTEHEAFLAADDMV